MKKRTGKMISLSLAVAMAMTAAPVTALADDNVQGSVIEANELTPVQSTGETGTDTTTVDTKEEEGTAWAELTPATTLEETPENDAKAGEVDSVEALKDAIDKAEPDTTITIATDLEIDELITVNKNVTITSAENVTITVGSNNTTFALSNGATLDGLHIVNNDATETTNANIVTVGNDSRVINCVFEGTYDQGSNQVLRATAVSPGVTGFVIEGNTIKNLRQPGYIEGDGTISENYVENTRGWVVCATAEPTLTNNTFKDNAIDIAIIANGATEDTTNFKNTIDDLSKDNNGAYVEHQVMKASAEDGVYFVEEDNDNATMDGALKDANDGDTIKLKTDITVTSTGSKNSAPGINITKAITLDGNEKTIKPAGEFTNENSLIGITGAKGDDTTPVVIKNLTLDGTNTTNVKHALNLYESTGVVIENVTAKDAKGYGLVLNSSEAVVKSMDISGYTWGAVNVDAKSSQDSSLVIEDGNFSGLYSIKVDHTQGNGSSDVTVKGGTFTGMLSEAEEDSLSITGGVYDTITDITKYLPAGITSTTDENGNIIVSVDPTVHENSIRVGYTWYTTEDELKELIKNGIPAGAIVEVYGKVNIPFSTGISKENGSIVEGYFVVDTDNVTIKGMTEDATLYTSEIHPNGTWGSQSFMLITGDNVTLEGLTIMPQATTDDGETNKTIEFVGNTLNMHNCTVKPNETPATNDGGSLYFNGDKDTVLVEDCTFDKVSVCFDSVDTAKSILIKDNTFVNPGDPYTIGNTSWTTPRTDVMAPITIEGNSFNGVTEDTTLVLQRMEGNFILTDNTVDNGKSIADFVDFDTEAIDTSDDSKMHITITENGKTVQLTPSTDGGQDPTAKEFKLNATSLSTKVGRSVTLTATFDNAEVAADWAVDGKEAATDKTSFEFTPNSKGTYIITASYEADGITYVATCEVTAKSSSGGGSSHSYDGYITIINPKNGDVSVSDTWADEDQKITLTITPDKGYEVDKIEIVDDEGDKIDAKKVEDEDDKYTFRMANCDVTVTVTFKEEGTTTEDTDKEDGKDEETTELNFTDVKESDWFYKGVAYVVDKGIMSGVSENQFDPSGKLTRAMLVQMLYNMESRPACDAENAFIDVPVGQWYTDAVIWANDAKIVSGMGDGLFAPNMEITREQMVAMLYNYAKYKGYDVTASADLSKFADSASVSTWAQPAMQWAVAEGYISGMGDNQLAPQGTATRAEIASVIMRFMEATAESAETAE